jgi:hypothetical protein
MRTFSRVLLLSVPFVIVTACGSSSSGTGEDEARAIACRGYVLNVGQADSDAVKEFRSQAGVDVDIDETHASLDPIRTAAVSAGTAPGLSESDYAVFRKVVEGVVEALGGRLVLDDGSETLPLTAIKPLEAAVSGVHKLCY